MSRTEPDWNEVESAWLQPPAGERIDSLGALHAVAQKRRRQRALALAEAIVSLTLLALAIIAVREHPGAAVWLVAAFIVAQAAGVWWVARRSHDVAQRALAQPTATFLDSWRRVCHRQLRVVRTGVWLVVVEVVLVAAVFAATGRWRSVPDERVWVLGLIAVLAMAVWLALLRSRVLAELQRASRMQRDLATEGRPDSAASDRTEPMM